MGGSCGSGILYSSWARDGQAVAKVRRPSLLGWSCLSSANHSGRGTCRSSTQTCIFSFYFVLQAQSSFRFFSAFLLQSSSHTQGTRNTVISCPLFLWEGDREYSCSSEYLPFNPNDLIVVPADCELGSLYSEEWLLPPLQLYSIDIWSHDFLLSDRLSSSVF